MSRVRQCYSGIGGQAVLEGIMMKNKDRYAVAVRKPDGEIAVTTTSYEGILGKSKIMKTPFIRGFFVFLDSLILGMKSLNFSASFFDEENTEKEQKKDSKKTSAESTKLLAVLTTVISIIIAVAVFMILPYFLASGFALWVRNASLLALFEGVIRVAIFILYVASISMMKDIKRVYMYHGAEHKCINCIEKGHALTVENVMKSSKQHKRCGTSFMLYVMLISIVLFFFIRVDSIALRIVLRIILIPVIAGIAYELIRVAGKYDGWFIRILSSAGLWLQGLTTREPDEKMVEVGIAAVEAVFDWKAYQEATFGYDFSEETMEYNQKRENLNDETEEAVYEQAQEVNEEQVEQEMRDAL